MVSKCANPGCCNHFFYMNDGKVFRFEQRSKTEGDFGFGARTGLPRRIEFFWLCSNCAAKMTLVFRGESGVAVQRLDCTMAAAA
jgi:hypothetical protein